MSMQIRKVAETATTITLGWDPVPGADGYRFYSAGVLRSKTMDPNRRTVKFSKGQEPYKIEAVTLQPLDSGTYPQSAPVYKKVAPRAAFKELGSDARFSLTTNGVTLWPGVVKIGSGPNAGKYTDESGAIYTDLDGLDESGVRSDAPAATGAREINGRDLWTLPLIGEQQKNTGSWTV